MTLHLSSSPFLTPSFPLELSDHVCLCLHLKEVPTDCWHASLFSPASHLLPPAVSSVLPLSASAGLLHPPPSPSISLRPYLHFSAGGWVGAKLQQLSTLSEQPGFAFPDPGSLALLFSNLGLASCLLGRLGLKKAVFLLGTAWSLTNNPQLAENCSLGRVCVCPLGVM